MKVVIDGVEFVPTRKFNPIDESELAALDARFDSDFGSNVTVRDFLYQLLSVLWKRKESFSGKRPFGNSGWENDVYTALVKTGHMNGLILSDDEWAEVNKNKSDEFMQKLIHYIFYGDKNPTGGAE